MNKKNPLLGRFISLCLAASLLLAATESISQETNETTSSDGQEISEPTPESREEKPLHIYGKVAGQIGWDMAGFLDLGLLIGKPAVSLQASVRGLAGLSVEGDWPCQGIGGNLGYRGIRRVHSKIRITFMIGPLYLYRVAKDPLTQTKYRYHIPAGTLAFGVIFGRGNRLSHGVELSSDLGYAIQSAPESGTDYSGFYGNGSIGYMLLF